jgi:hypothetical protein
MAKSFRFILIYLVIISLSFSFNSLAYAFPSSSTNYKLDAELGVFGGEKSSTNYRLTDTGGGFAPGFSNSTNYLACSGFQCQLSKVPTITFSLSSTAVNLGTLTTSAISIQSHTATVTTNFQGYSLTVVQDGNLCRIALPCNSSNDIDAIISGPSVLSAGTEAYGLATSKSGQNINQYSPGCNSSSQFSAITTSTQTVANSLTPTATSGDITTLCYAATAGGATAAGTYTQNLTYIATGKF